MFRVGRINMYIDLTGNKYGRLHVEGLETRIKYPSGKTEQLWNCVCDCGNRVIVRGTDLKSGHTKSCGCLRKEKTSRLHSTHKLTNTRLYRIWIGIKNRCLNEKQPSYEYYGKRGISICDEWKESFESFNDWANKTGYSNKLTIERIDVNGDYCPENCKWILPSEQYSNRTDSRNITYNGETKTLAEWAKIYGLDYNCLLWRIDKGKWDLQKALETESRRKRNKLIEE